MEPNPYEAPAGTAEIQRTRREREDRHNLTYLLLVFAALILLAVLCALPAMFYSI